MCHLAEPASADPRAGHASSPSWRLHPGAPFRAHCDYQGDSSLAPRRRERRASWSIDAAVAVACYVDDVIRQLLLVDDDVGLTRILAAALAEEEFAVATAHDGATALRLLDASPPDLVILDVLLPEIDGLSLCRRIRARSDLPIILLSSRAEEVDRVAGLDMGADDYVTKPFSTRELCARIRAIDRRLADRDGRRLADRDGRRLADRDGRRLASRDGRARDAALTVGELHIDPGRFVVRWRDRPVELTRSEFQLLYALVRERGFVLSRDRLLDLVRGSDVTTTDRTVDTFVKRIRKKIREVDPDFDAIETVFGVGYRYP
jgi:two-component system response regulator ChvI